MTANGLDGSLGETVLSHVEEVQKKGLEKNFKKLVVEEVNVLEIMKNPKNVVRPNVQVTCG